MKCPCCGKEMIMDAHTKIDKFMCYNCGYIEGRAVVPAAPKAKVSVPRHHGLSFYGLLHL